MWSYLRVDGIGNNESSLVHHRGFVGKFTFPKTPNLEEREQMLGRGSIVNTISVTPYKCTRSYGSGLGGGLAAVQVKHRLLCPFCFITPHLSNHSRCYEFFLRPKRCTFTLHGLLRFLFFPFWSPLLSSHKIKKHNYLCLLSYPPFLLYSAGEWSPLYLRKGFDNITTELPSLLYQY